jgi:hypothetical protein
MKTFLSTLTALIAITNASRAADGYVYFDGSQSQGLVTELGQPLTNMDINAALINVTGGQNITVATLLLSNGTATGDITTFGDGHLFDNSGTAYDAGTAAGPTTFIVEGWLGNYNSYGSALFKAQTSPFTEVTLGLPIPPVSLDNMPNLNFAPEPGAASLLGLGAASALIFRWKANARHSHAISGPNC